MIAKGLVQNDVRTYITARKTEACDTTAKRLSEMGECRSVRADLSTEEGIAALTGLIRGNEDQLDILINNAGTAWGAPLDEFPADGFDKSWT